MAQELQEADCEEGMMAALDAVGASMEVKESFRREKVYRCEKSKGLVLS